MPSRFRPFVFPHPIGLAQPEIRTETVGPELNGLAKHRALVADAIALGLPGKGTNEELQAAIDAKLAEGGQ
jgi:hypothetical protein